MIHLCKLGSKYDPHNHLYLILNLCCLNIFHNIIVDIICRFINNRFNFYKWNIKGLVNPLILSYFLFKQKMFNIKFHIYEFSHINLDVFNTYGT